MCLVQKYVLIGKLLINNYLMCQHCNLIDNYADLRN